MENMKRKKSPGNYRLRTIVTGAAFCRRLHTHAVDVEHIVFVKDLG